MTYAKTDPSKPRQRGKQRTPFKSKERNRNVNWSSLWELERDGVTQGSLNLFLTCRHQFYLGMIEGLSPKKSSDALDFGTAFHAILSTVHTGDSIPRALEIFRKTLSTRLTTGERDAWNLILSQIEIILPHYQARWGEDDAKKIWIAREQTFNIPFTLDTGYKIPLRGRWDGLFALDKSLTSPLWLLETKTKGQIDEDGIQASLPFDLQTMLYYLVAEQHFHRPVAGIVYDVIRRPGLRLGKTEALGSFLGRIAADVATRRDEHYLFRWEVQFAKNDTTNWCNRQLIPILTQLSHWYSSISADLQDPWKSNLHYINPTALFGRYGRCDFFDLITKSDAFLLQRRKHVYPELET